jgi:AraC-like DNA-binding protein
VTRFASAVSKESNAVRQTFLVEDGHAYFSVKRKFTPRVSPAQVDAFQIAVWVSLLHRVLDFRWDPTLIIVRLHDPAALPEEFHGVRPIRCDAQGFSFRFPGAWLSHRMSPDLLDPPPGLESPQFLEAPSDLLSLVESVLRPRIGEADLDSAKAARACGFGIDTLNRRMRKLNTSVSRVLAGLRREEAKRALTYGEATVGEIAGRLGYSDATAFSRAFRNWTGKSPTAFRLETNEGRLSPAAPQHADW